MGKGEGPRRRQGGPDERSSSFDSLSGAGLLRTAIRGRRVPGDIDPSTARTIGETRERRFRVAGHAPSPTAPGAKLEDLFEQIERGESATLNLILKTDVQGTLEAITDSLRKLEREEVKLSFVHRGVGGVTENDVQLAAASNATIIGFNVRPDRCAREMAADRDVEIRTYEIIYKLLEDIEAAMLGMLAPEFEEIVTGEAEVREVFRIPRVGAVAGCYVRDGVSAGIECALPTRRCCDLEGFIHFASALQRRRSRSAGRLRVRSRGCRTSRISMRATSSRPSRSARSPRSA